LNLKRRRRLRLIGLAAGAGALLLAGTYFYTPVASADVGGSFASVNNASDPFVFKCFDRDTNLNGYCMYTSQDLGTSGPAGNPYPMQNTLGFFSTDGRNWTPRGTNGVIFTETQLGFVPSGAKHLWAPAAVQQPNGDTFLLVPDVANMTVPNPSDPWAQNVHTSSRIAVAAPAMGAGAFGPFQATWFLTDGNGNVPGYMSDPEPFSDSTGQYLMWANGDGDTCGGLSMSNLSPGLELLSNVTDVQVTGWPSWGTCTLTAPFTANATHPRTVSRPYLEGPSLFKFSDSASDLAGLPATYTLVVPAKPTSVPPECSHFAQPNQPNSVIAYATSTNVRGPYTYQGLLMCGSGTEWTNQATIAEIPMANGTKRMVLIYHDGPSGTHNRKLHAECLWYGAGTFAMASRSATGFSDCMNGAGNGAWAFRSHSFKPEGVVSAVQDNNKLLLASRAAVGPWEQFDVLNSSGAPVSPTAGSQILWDANIRSRFNNQFVSAESAGTSYLIANRTAAAAWEKFILVLGGWTGTVAFTSEASGLEVTTAGDRTLRPTNPARAPDEQFDILHL
jgi:hypothetical protein